MQQLYGFDAAYSNHSAPLMHSPYPHASAIGSPPSSAESSPLGLVNGLPRHGRIRAQSLTTKLQSMVGGKSTAHITQQQLNKKRQRATPEQLAVLEEAFEVNPSPNAKQREVISAQIDMTERSVQIWFQNRRAKTKSASKRTSGAHDDSYQHARPGAPARSFSIDQRMLFEHEAQHLGSNDVTRLTCRSLTIGSWRRVACTLSDLVLYFTHHEPRFTYYINSGASGFKLEFPLTDISKIDLQFLEGQTSKELGRITLTIVKPPVFFMEVPGPGTWSQCTDFTEHQQATLVHTHLLVGPYATLKTALMKMAHYHPSVASVMTLADVLQSQPATAAFPVSPDRELFARAGQQAASALEQESKAAGQFARGPGMHRRTRSRSAPIALDFSFLNNENVGGMPNYSFGQRSARPEMNFAQLQQEPTQRFDLSMSGDPYAAAALSASQSIAPGTDYPEMIFTPTTSSTPVFPGGSGIPGWYNTHNAASGYAESPLLSGSGVHSALASPMLPSGSQYGMSSQPSLVAGLQQQQHAQTLNDFSMGVPANEPLMHFPAQSMPDLLNSIPEAETIPPPSLQASLAMDGSTGGHAAKLDLGGSLNASTMHGADLQSAQLAAMVAMNMETNAMIVQQAQQEQEDLQMQDHGMQ